MFYDKEVIRDYVEEGMTPDEAEASIEQTVQAAKSASKVVLFLGESSVRLERRKQNLYHIARDSDGTSKRFQQLTIM